jgi:hypothetical protein
MLEALAEQIRAEMAQDIHQEIERIYQELLELEKHHRRPVKPVSKHEQPLLPTTLKDVIKDAMGQAAREEGLSRKKKKKTLWLLLAERLEEAHRLGIYKEPVNTICRFICLIHPTGKHNTIRKALPLKYKDPNQSKIAHRQMKGLPASIYRHNRQRKKKMASNNSHLQQVSEEGPLKKKVASSSVTPYKEMARCKNHTFASWLRRFKRKKYNKGIFEKIKKDKAFHYVCSDMEFALWYIREVYHPSQKELSAVHRAMKIYKEKNSDSSVTPYK